MTQDTQNPLAGLDPQIQEALAGLSPEQAKAVQRLAREAAGLAKAQKKADRDAAKAKKAEAKQVKVEAPEELPLVIYNADENVTSVALSDLRALDDLPFEQAGYAMREINKQHLEHMLAALREGDEFPPIRVVNTNYGLVPVDGYHRWAMYEIYLKEIIESSLDPEADQEIDPEVLASARKEYFIPSKEVQVSSITEMMDEAFRANFANGVPASDSTRSRYALWLLEINRNNGTPISIREAARKARVSHVAVLKYAKKEQARKNKMVDVVFSEEDSTDLETIEETKETELFKKADTHMRNLLKAAEYFSTQEWSSEELDLFVTGYIGKSKVTREQINTLYSLLNKTYNATPASTVSQPVLPETVFNQ